MHGSADAPELVRKHIKMARQGLERVRAAYKDVLLCVDAAAAKRTVYEKVKHFCLSQLPLQMGDEDDTADPQ